MKNLANLALAAALATGVAGGALVAPAVAAKKEEAKPGLKLSPEFLKVAKPAQDALVAMTLRLPSRWLPKPRQLQRLTTKSIWPRDSSSI